MKHRHEESRPLHTRMRGFSVAELMIVVFIAMVVAAIVIPSVMRAVYSVRLRSTAGDLAGLMQQARILAAKNNAIYGIRYGTIAGAPGAYVDLNGNGIYDAGEPLAQFSANVAATTGPPSGGGGQPTPYVLVGDSSTGQPYSNTTTLGFSPRGLPCDYTNPPTCNTPATSYFVYYLTETQVLGPPIWGAVVVTKSGRSKAVTWTGAAWK